ncbi:Ig-like domain-containing protein [Aureimonas glaciei]|nr:Ig-like domain-containing protein [Aureimonas glaciei]
MHIVRGSKRADALVGTDMADLILGLSGDDSIDAKAGADFVVAGQGDDMVRGGRGDDTLIGGSGTDTAAFEGSVDNMVFRNHWGGILQVQGSEGKDTLQGFEYLKIGDKTYSAMGPIARTDRVEVAENQAIKVDVLANDQSLSNGGLKIQKIGGGNARAGDTVAVVDGIAVKLDFDGKLALDPGASYDSLSAGEMLEREFSYIVGNGSGSFATARVKLTIYGKNDGPVAISDTASAREATPLIIAASDLLANDRDIDRLDVLAVTGVAATDGTHGTVLLEGGQITYTPEAGYSGPASFDYTIGDGKGAAATATVNVEVISGQPNVAPDTAAVMVATDEGVAIAITLAGTDPDGTVASFQVTSLPNDGGLFLDAAGTQAVDPDNIPADAANSATIWFIPGPVLNGTVTLEYVAVDDDEARDETPSIITIEVAPVDDDAPLITSNGGGAAATLSLNENSLAVTAITVTDSDDDGGPLALAPFAALAVNQVLYSVEGTDAALFSISGSGDLAFLAAPDFENPTDFDMDNVYDVTVRVTDRTGRTDSQDIAVTISNLPGSILVGDQDVNQRQDTLVGTGEEDTISGLTMADLLSGLGGNDFISGGSGGDLLDGGDGDDTLLGDEGPDTLLGGAGDDFLDGGNNDDRLEGGDGADLMIGGNGVDTFIGGRGADSMTGGAGQDWVDYGAEELIQRGNAETLRGVEVNQLGIDDPSDPLPHDTAVDTFGNRDQIVEIRNVNGTSLNDWIRGGGQANILQGNAGDDILRGRGDNDIVDGGAGTDTAEYSGNWSDYQITHNADGSLTVRDLRPGGNLSTDGIDTVIDVESFQFADGTRDLASVLIPVVPTTFDLA